MQEDINFFKVAFSNPHTGAIARSSRYVVRAVLDLIANRKLSQIIEYGPGDGVVTKELLKQLSVDGRLLAVEIDQKFFETLRSVRDPRLQVVNGTIQDVSRNTEAHGFHKVDLVVSSIPFSSLSSSEREEVVCLTKKILAPGGMFIIFHQYSSIMARPLKKYFSQVEVRFEPRNFFPCFIMSASGG